MRLQVHIIPAHAAPSAAPVSTFLEVALPSLSLEDLTGSITNRYRRLYPHRPPLRIDRLQDSAQNDLDLSYTVEDVFSDKASDALSSIVRVVQASSVRESSIPPESGLRISQFARRKRARPTVMMEPVRETSNERGLSHSQPLSHSQSVSLQPSRGSGRQRSSKRQRLNDFLVGDSMDEREENLAVRNWNNEVVSDPLVNSGTGAGFEDYNYDGVLGNEDNNSFKTYRSSSPGPGHEDKSTHTPEPNQTRPGLGDPIGDHDPRSDPETPESIQQRIPTSPELHTVGHTKGFPEGHASSGNTKHQETSRPLQPSRSSGPLHYTPTATEKLGVRKGALAARAGRQTVAEKLAARADRHTLGGPIVGANHFTAPVPSPGKPSIYSVPASDEEDNVLPMPKTQTPNSASKLRQPSIVSETTSEEADDESQQVLERGTEGEKDETEKESESERQAIREERESREREAKEKKDKEAREVAAKAAEQRQRAAKAAKERAEKSRIEKERLEKEKERLEKERLEGERLEKERLEKERLEKERLEKERLEKERLEKERLEKERLEKERLEKERLEKERLEKERLEKERLEKERLEKERLERQKIEKKRVAQEILATQKAERERIAQEKAIQEQAAQTRAAKEAAALESDKADEGLADLKAAEAALSVTVLRKSHGKGAIEASQEKTVGETPTLKRTTRAAVNKGAVERETAAEISQQEEKADRGGKKKETAKQKKDQEALQKKNKEKAEEEAKKESAKEKKKRFEEQKAEAEAKKEAAKEKKEREALEKKKRLEEQKAEREAKKKEAAEERVRKAKERAEKAKAEREKKNGQTFEGLAQMKEGEVPSQNSLGESEPAIPPTPSQGMKSNLKGSAVKKHPTRVSFATTADTSIPPASQPPIKQTPILPPGYERNNQEAPDWVNTRKTPSSPGVNSSQAMSDSVNGASEPVTNGTAARPKSKATESIKAAKVVTGRATSLNPKLNGKTPASAIKQSMEKLVEPAPESETGSEAGSETGSETSSESNDSGTEATKATAIALLKSAKAISSTEDVEMPDVPSSPTPKQPFAVAVYNTRRTSDKQLEETGSDSENAPPSGQKALEETESESDYGSKASASGTDSGSDSESDSDATGKTKPTLAKTLFKGRTYGKRHSLSASQSINGSQRYKSLTAMEMAPIPDVREVHQSSQSGRNTSTPKASSPTKLQRSKKPAVPQDEDSEDSESSIDSSGSSEDEEVIKPRNNALNGRMASASAKRKSGFGGFGFKV
ncbi:hypothetical protein DFP73DRAFT_633913 [Morchella snyderi]|nr:hypothetical protein DFP73DRAFT_633913 [Morchella snyderi]